MNNYQIPIYNTLNVANLAPVQNPVQIQRTAASLPPVQYANLNATYPSNYYTMAPQGAMQVPSNIKTQGADGGWKLEGIEKTPYGENIYKYTLKNGQTVALMPRENSTTVIKTYVDAGAMNENDYNRGISHFNEHNVFNGSKNLAPGKFFKEVSKLGAETNASTDFAQTDFYISSPIVDGQSLKQIIEMHSDMLVNPLFPEDKVEKEKGPVTSEISMCNDDITNRAMNTLIKNLFQINSKSQDLVAGSIETVNNITRDDVYNHWKKHFTPDNMYTVLTGDFDPNEAIEIISKNFTTPSNPGAESERTKEILTPTQKSVRADYISPNNASTNVFCGFSGALPSDTKDALALEALGMLLLNNKGSRLSKELDTFCAMGDFGTQKIGLRKTDPKAIVYQFATQKGDDSKAIDKFYETVQSLQTNPPTNEEMTIIKNSLLKYLASNYEDTEVINSVIGSSLLDGDFGTIHEQKTAIESLTPQDIVNVANKYLDFSKMSVAVVHPYNTTEEEIKTNYANSAHSIQNNQVAFTGAKREINTDKVEQYTLNDNSTLTLNNSNSEISYIDWRLTSKETIPENPACSYVLTQILNNGTQYKTRAEFSNEANKNSISCNLEANSFQVQLNASCLNEHTGEAINSLKELLYAPDFSQEKFDSAVQKVRTYCSTESKNASTNLLSKLYGKYFPSPKQILDGLETLTLDDVKAHYNNLIYNSSSNIVVSAPIEKHPELKTTVTNGMNTPNLKFKPYAPKLMQSYIPNDKETVLVDTEERNQAQIYKNYSFEISGNIKDEIKFELLNTILGGSPSSRLFQDLREQQKLAYTVSSQIQSFENSGILTLRILSTTDDKEQNDIKYDNLQKCLDGFKAHTDKLMNEDVTDEELEAAKMQLKQDIAMQLELPSMSTWLLSMNMTQPFGIKRIDEYVKAIDTITKQDIKDAANHVFKNKPVYSILASEDTINNQANYINGLGEVVRV